MNGSTETIIEQAELSVVPPITLKPAETALKNLGRWLQESGYRFQTITPSSHARVNRRQNNAHASSLTDIFGWSRRFSADLLPPNVFLWMTQAEALEKQGQDWVSRVRYSSLFGNSLFLHSAFPTIDPDSVFFGPDTYRFAAWVRQSFLPCNRPAPERILEIACGSGAVGILAARDFGSGNSSLLLTDINPRALSYCRVNAALADLKAVEVRQSDVCADIDGEFDLILANPPYLLDADRRLYRHGGGTFGGELSMRILREALPRLRPNGQLFLYTGAAIVDGIDTFYHQALPILNSSGCIFSYQEIDPDVFGEELDQPAMRYVDRIAAVGLKIVAAPGCGRTLGLQ